MRPSKLKTPLAKLRAMLNKKSLPRITQQDVAEWLGCGVDNIASIESGRVKLTQANARIIERQTMVSSSWLLGKIDSSKPITFEGTLLRRFHFDRSQAALKSPYRVPTAANFALKNTLVKLTTIIVQAAKSGQIDLYESKLETALNDILNSFPANWAKADFRKDVDSFTDHNTPDFKPLFAKYQQQIMKVCNDKRLVSGNR
jgi:hypothetical protein